jgi:hypothetical protein|tara:strand:+ start:544 stop:699 length:156 start_codon:yes stop_codon:yes gene_type:complete
MKKIVTTSRASLSKASRVLKKNQWNLRAKERILGSKERNLGIKFLKKSLQH